MATSYDDGERRLDRFGHTYNDAEARKPAVVSRLWNPMVTYKCEHDRDSQGDARVVVGVDQLRRLYQRHRRFQVEALCQLHKLSVIRLCNKTIAIITLDTNTCKHNSHNDNITFLQTHCHLRHTKWIEFPNRLIILDVGTGLRLQLLEGSRLFIRVLIVLTRFVF